MTLSLLLGFGAPAVAAKRLPNFVVIVADDMAWNDCGAYGHPHIRTPNIDRLAQEGMRFDRAFLTCSSCSPSRCSTLSGRYPHATGAPELHMPLPVEQQLVSEPLRKAGYYTASVGKWHLGDAAMPKFDKVNTKGAPSGCGCWIEELRARPADKPFFFWLASFDPHRGYSPNTIEVPHRPADAVVPPFLPDTPETRGDLNMYYDEITRLDGFVGQVLDELKRQNVADNTLVLFFSDNGRPFPRCKTTVYDSGIQTPFIVCYPPLVKPGSVTGSLVSTVDIAPTMLALAGLPVTPNYQGRSFVPILKDPAAETRQYVFAEHNWHDYMAYKRGVRSKRYTYIRNWVTDLNSSPPADAVRSPTYRKMQQLHAAGELPPEQSTCFTVPQPAEELYDVQTDPFSMNNLAADPAYADALRQMSDTLDQWRRETDDEKPEHLTPDGFNRKSGGRLPR